MKLAVFDEYRVGVVEEESLRDVTDALPRELDLLPHHRMNWVIAKWAQLRETVRNHDGALRSLSDVTLRACSPAPQHIFALPGNYAEHLGEIGAMTVSGKRTANEMGFFLKAPGSLVGAGEQITLPRDSMRRFDHECELAAIIGADTFGVPAAQAKSAVFGYACAVDATMRIDPDGRQEDRSMRKSFATFTPVGPYLVTADEVGDPHDLATRLSINNDVRQSANTAQMIVDVWNAIEIISSVVPLRPGDIVLTGTPSGVGPIHPGDTLEISIDRVGTMTLPIQEGEHVSPRTF